MLRYHLLCWRCAIRDDTVICLVCGICLCPCVYCPSVHWSDLLHTLWKYNINCTVVIYSVDDYILLPASMRAFTFTTNHAAAVTGGCDCWYSDTLYCLADPHCIIRYQYSVEAGLKYVIVITFIDCCCVIFLSRWLCHCYFNLVHCRRWFFLLGLPYNPYWHLLLFISRYYDTYYYSDLLLMPEMLFWRYLVDIVIRGYLCCYAMTLMYTVLLFMMP